MHDFLLSFYAPHLDDLHNLVFWKVQIRLTIRWVKAPDLLQSLFCFCVYLSAILCVCVCTIISLQSEKRGCPSFPYQLTELQVKAGHAEQSIEPLLIYLGTVLPCLEGRGMEMSPRMEPDSEGDLWAWLELLVERHIIEQSLLPTAPLGNPPSWKKIKLIRGDIDHHLFLAQDSIKAQTTSFHFSFSF